jgi:hypothetical protein
MDRTTTLSHAEQMAAGILSVNAYPWEPYGAMVTCLENDDLTHRVLPDNRNVFTPQPNKTIIRGCKEDWYHSLFFIADNRASVVIENSPASGMSSPFRRHAQLFPLETQKGLVLRELQKTVPAPSDRQDGVLYARSRIHPFDTLLLHSQDKANLAAALQKVQTSIDTAGGISTYAYANGWCVVSVQTLKDSYAFNRIGARVALNYYEESEVARWDEHVAPIYPQPQCFDWQRVCRLQRPIGYLA